MSLRLFQFPSKLKCLKHVQLVLYLFNQQSLKDHIMQVHQPTPDSMNGAAQHFTPPPSLLSPGLFPFNLNTGANEGGRRSRSPNNLNTHACSYTQCSASFPTLELLEKHEMLQHSSGATNVVSSYFFYLKFYLKQKFCK